MPNNVRSLERAPSRQAALPLLFNALLLLSFVPDDFRIGTYSETSEIWRALQCDTYIGITPKLFESVLLSLYDKSSQRPRTSNESLLWIRITSKI